MEQIVQEQQWNIVEETDALKIASILTVIFGDLGMGKTSLSMQSEESILLDFDDGLKRSTKRKRAVQMRTFAGALDFIRSEKFKELKPRTVILDTGGTLLDNYIAHYVIENETANKKKGGGLSLQGYGALKEVFSQFINELKRMQIDIVIVCHTEQYKDGESLRFRPKMTGGSYDILMQVADLVGYMESKNEKRTLNFNPTDRHIGKNAPNFANFIIPHAETIEFDNFLGRIIADAKEKMSKLDEEQQKALLLLDEKRKEVDEADTFEKLVALTETFADLKPAFQIQLSKLVEDKKTEFIKVMISGLTEPLQLDVMLNEIKTKYGDSNFYKRLLNDRKTGLGFEFDKDNGVFVKPEVKDEPGAEVKEEDKQPVLNAVTEVPAEQTNAPAEEVKEEDKQPVLNAVTEVPAEQTSAPAEEVKEEVKKSASKKKAEEPTTELFKNENAEAKV